MTDRLTLSAHIRGVVLPEGFYMIWTDKWGWPLTRFRKRPVINLIRWLLYARGRAIWWTDGKGGWRHTRELIVTPRLSEHVGVGGGP